MLKDESQDKVMGKIKILIADDHYLIRQALRNLLEKETDFLVVAEAKDGLEAVDLVSNLDIDVVIMDIGMPRLNGIEATRKIKAVSPQTIVLVLTVHEDSEHIINILEAGASAYLTKDVIGDEIPRAIRAIMDGESILSEEAMKQLLRYVSRYQTKPITLEYGEMLTSKEIAIIGMAANGLSNKVIAQELNLSLNTVKKYMMNIFRKLQVNSRTEAVIKGQRIGLIHINNVT